VQLWGKKAMRYLAHSIQLLEMATVIAIAGTMVLSSCGGGGETRGQKAYKQMRSDLDHPKRGERPGYGWRTDD
jgi:hypothetical protein